MSGECSFFNFCLRGRDSLVSKWISQKRKIPETLKTDGANIYAISEYIHTVFYFDKLYGSDYSCNVLFNKIIAINELDKNHIVKFDEIIKIPFDFTPYEFTERSFDDMAKDVSGAEFSAVTLGSVLSDSEIKELLINIYHINYDLRENENIKNKTYDEIISGRFIEFKDKASLSFFIPYIFEISAKKVAESSKSPVEVPLATSSIQPELSNTTVEGYFYKRTTGEADEKNKKYKGASKKAYAVNEFKEKYYESDVIDLNINNDDLNIFANSTAKESSGNKKESYAIASTIVNLATYRNKTILNTLKTEGIYGYNDGGNSTSYKNRFFMVNKKVQNINSFFNQFIKITNITQTKNDETLIKFYFYLESKKLPRYWKPVWDIRYIDELSEHKEDLLFVITTDNNLNIENIDANDGI